MKINSHVTRRRVKDGVPVRQVNFEAPVPLYQAIYKRAVENGRSVTSEICVILQSALAQTT